MPLEHSSTPLNVEIIPTCGKKNIFVDACFCACGCLCVCGRQQQCQLQQGSDLSSLKCLCKNKTWTAGLCFLPLLFLFLFFLNHEDQPSLNYYDCNSRKTSEKVWKSHLISDISTWSATVKQSISMFKCSPKDASVSVERRQTLV